MTASPTAQVNGGEIGLGVDNNAVRQGLQLQSLWRIPTAAVS